jgi:selenocysteine lyase/cysteine desulfurase
MADSVPLPPSSVRAAASQFGSFDGRIWLNTAHQGPLPRPAVAAAAHAAALKVAPHRIADGAFDRVPERLRALLAGLVGSPPDQIVLGNSTSYGLHLVANGLPWRAGDEVLVLAGDYPATVLPWQRLSDRGVTTTALQPAGDLLTGGELAPPSPTGPGYAPSPGLTLSPAARLTWTRWARSAGRPGCCWWSTPPRRSGHGR